QAETKQAETKQAETKQAETKAAPPADAAQAKVQSESPGSALAAVDKSANPTLKAGDWPQWAGSTYRNNTPVAQNIPTSWTIGEIDRKSGEWKKDGSENIRWVSRLGSQTYGNPVIADGRVYVGTNNTGGYLKRYPSDYDLGVLLCFQESDGKFLWQHSSEKLPPGRVHVWPLQGICCAPYVEGYRLWFVTSRGEVACLDAEGFHDGEDDGPLQNELGRLFDVAQNEDAAKDKLAGYVTALNEGKLVPELAEKFAAAGAPLPEGIAVKTDEPGKKWSFSATVQDAPREFRITVVGLAPTQRMSAWKVISPADKDEADRIWVLDMMAKLQVSQHNMCSCSITALGDLLFINTSNGVDEAHIDIPQVEAPSFICVDKNTGEVYWTDKSPGNNILHGQWSSPALAKLGGVTQVIFGGGDGWVYSFKADKGQDGKPELLWEFDANPKETKYSVDGRSTRNHIIGTPVIYDGLVYVAVGEDPEHGEGDGHLWCIDPTKRGDVSAQLAVNVSDRSKPLPKRRLQALFPEQGDVAIDNPNSAAVWHFSKYDTDGDGKISFEETMHRTCGTVAIKNDLLFVADFSGLFHCLDAKTGKVHWTYDMLAASWGSPLIVEDRVYIGDEDGDISIFNLSAEPHEPIAENTMENSVYTSPVVANNTLFIANKSHLFAIGGEKAAE
ncbi:MAG: PQQ-binding-like beta-propeller repeat protein, partial [Pirellulaceae bacterium]